MKTFITLLLCLLTYGYATACSCIMKPIKEDVKNSKFIVKIKVEKLLDTAQEREDYIFSNPDRSYRIQASITEQYKGTLSKGDLITIESEFSNCEFYYRNQHEYLLFLRKEKGHYKLEFCTHSEPIENAEKNIKEIKKILRLKKKK